MVAYVPEGSEVPTSAAVEKALAAKLHPEAPDPVVRAEEGENIATVPAVARASSGAAPKMTRSQLDNGVTLLVKRRATVPMVSMLTLRETCMLLEALRVLQLLEQQHLAELVHSMYSLPSSTAMEIYSGWMNTAAPWMIKPINYRFRLMALCISAETATMVWQWAQPYCLR